MKHTLLIISTILLLFSCGKDNNNENNNSSNKEQEQQIEATIVKKESYRKIVFYTIRFKNNSNKPVKGIKGIIKFKDNFGDIIHELGVKTEINIPAKDTLSGYFSEDINKFSDKEVEFSRAKIEDYKYTWETIQVIQ